MEQQPGGRRAEAGAGAAPETLGTLERPGPRGGGGGEGAGAGAGSMKPRTVASLKKHKEWEEQKLYAPFEHDGDEWGRFEDSEGKPYFMNFRSKKSLWQDPRPAPQPAAEPQAAGKELGDYFELDAEKWGRFEDPASGVSYYHNFASGQSVWEDPRPAFDLSRTEHRVAVAGIVGFFVAAFAVLLLLRLRYLRAHYPELLNPTMKRKARKAKWKRRPAYSNSKNRMSQDGKGGRSANS